ncbi:hypothetical protein J5N97_029520 [Dioscorea zingiberensis]|uniref:Uncharacterized protein n=1 Tax=Dioscorea zingiberensis TaxID=325984 RepID=A0A9D5H5W8_9LILI|nr:hypothetical protein J5N97_029520 [Dioscorea zingiberensis]
MDLQNTLAVQMSQTGHLKSQLESVNQVLFNSEREIQRLRKAIADHCVAERGPEEMVRTQKADMLKKEVGKLNEVIEGKELVLHSCKEQKVVLNSKMKELQLRLQ